MSLARTFAALADETRLDIVNHLLAHGETRAGGLVERTGLSAPAVSRHLRVLREAGVVETRAEGTVRHYSVRPQPLRSIAGWALDHRDFWSGSLERLDEMLAADPGGGDEGGEP